MTNGKVDARGAMKGIISLVVIIVAAIFLLWYFKGGDNAAISRDLKVLAINVENGTAVQAVQKVGESFPLKNSEGRKILWQAFVCRKCNILFPNTPGVMFTPCPICGSKEVGSATIEDINMSVKMPDISK